MTGNLAIAVSAGSSHVLVAVTGECDVTTAPRLLAALSAQVAGDGGRLVVADLSALTYLDAAGVQALLVARRVQADHGSSLVLASPQRIVSRILEFTRADRHIPIYRDLAGALAADRHDLGPGG